MRRPSACGSRVQFHMTGPQGEQSRGYWEALAVGQIDAILDADAFAKR